MRSVILFMCNTNVLEGLLILVFAVPQLWLSWNEAVRAGFAGGVLDPQQYEAGRQQFESLLAASDTNALEELTNGECDLDDSWDL